MANDWRKLVDQVIELQKDPDMDTSPAPSLQWFPQQWLGDAAVQLMAMPARGCHHHLLMTAWKGFDLDGNAVPCSLPDDQALLGSLCQSPDGWDDVWPQIRRAWKVHEGRIWNLGLVRSYLRQMEKRRKAKGSAAARWRQGDANAPSEQCVPDANASEMDANASKMDANASETQCSSASASPSASATATTSDPEEKNPPRPPKGGSVGKKKRSGRKIPNVEIPEELIAIGIDQASFEGRVRCMKVTKPVDAWQAELNLLAPMIEEVGGEFLKRFWDENSAAGNQGCQPSWIRTALAREAGNNGNGAAPRRGGRVVEQEPAVRKKRNEDGYYSELSRWGPEKAEKAEGAKS